MPVLADVTHFVHEDSLIKQTSRPCGHINQTNNQLTSPLPQQQKLSQAALETLSIIAYRQPVMRAEVEVIRGVACGEVLRGLMDRRLVKIVGRAEELGRPMLYGTSREFLQTFGLASLDDLPEVQGLIREPSWKPAAPPVEDIEEDSEDSDDYFVNSNYTIHLFIIFVRFMLFVVQEDSAAKYKGHYAAEGWIGLDWSRPATSFYIAR